MWKRDACCCSGTLQIHRLNTEIQKQKYTNTNIHQKTKNTNTSIQIQSRVDEMWKRDVSGTLLLWQACMDTKTLINIETQIQKIRSQIQKIRTQIQKIRTQIQKIRTQIHNFTVWKEMSPAAQAHCSFDRLDFAKLSRITHNCSFSEPHYSYNDCPEDNVQNITHNCSYTDCTEDMFRTSHLAVDTLTWCSEHFTQLSITPHCSYTLAEVHWIWC